MTETLDTRPAASWHLSVAYLVCRPRRAMNQIGKPDEDGSVRKPSNRLAAASTGIDTTPHWRGRASRAAVNNQLDISIGLWQSSSPMPESMEGGHRETLAEVMRDLVQGDVEIRPMPEHEQWDDPISRITTPGCIHQITWETADYFLNVLPPKWMHAGYFAFAEGQEPLRLFWSKGDMNYCRQLTWEETYRFCDASGLSRHYGSM